MLRVPQSPTCPHRRSVSSSSADTSSSAPTSPTRLRMAGVANLFVRARRAQRRVVFGQQQAQEQQQDLQQQQQQQQQKRPAIPGQIIFTSGEPKTHPAVELSMQSSDEPHFPVELAESFVCQGGVNVLPLLMATRNDLLDRTEAAFGAATLTDEQWECIITEPKTHSNSIYKVQVRYNACATWTSLVRNPARPVCIEQAGCVPGLMTVLKRRVT